MDNVVFEGIENIVKTLKDNGVEIKLVHYTNIEGTRRTIFAEKLDFSEHDKGFLEQIKYFEDAVAKFERTVEEKQDEIDRIKELNDKCYEENIRLERENKELHKELQETAITDNLPYEPIAVAEMLITATAKYEANAFQRAFAGIEGSEYNIYGISELRQIAEHLLVYCNNNKDE